ncbi:hypothetical protein DPMN_072518 [Dreissena polymorpha]|uniref:Uncharacterized protein n=1 Tax=Dreissena polymorpha TaxID=45954 RepID=A0A9D3Z8D1_DREPO|nr:hypothetical protein DPMN_072518 [Dreissena polymorpha]
MIFPELPDVEENESDDDAMKSDEDRYPIVSETITFSCCGGHIGRSADLHPPRTEAIKAYYVVSRRAKLKELSEARSRASAAPLERSARARGIEREREREIDSSQYIQ